jgi:adenylate cyclase
MRAGAWLTHRDVTAARASWQRARLVADRLVGDDPQRAAMRIAPRTMLCATAFMAGGSMADTGYDELRQLADSTGDKTSLAMGMTGWIMALVIHARLREASQLASELADLLESIGNPTLTLGLLYGVVLAKYQAGDMAETLEFAERVFDLADGDLHKGNLIISSPLAGAFLLRGCTRCCLGDQRWRGDVGKAATIVRALDGRMRALGSLIRCGLTINNGVLVPDAMAEQETAELLEITERSADRYALNCAQYVRGITLVARYGPHHAEGLALLRVVREAALQQQFTRIAATLVATHLATAEARAGNVDGAIELSRDAFEDEIASGDKLFRGRVTFTLVEALLRRGLDTDLREAQSAIDQLAAMPIEAGFVMHEIWLLRMRALLARARGDEAAYRDYRDRYLDMARTLAFEGHIAWAEAMP